MAKYFSRSKKRKFAAYARKHPTRHEALLGKELLTGAAGVVFKAQVILRGFVADFLAPSARLLVEVDGTSHTSREGRLKDALRDRVLLANGYRTLRFTHDEIEGALPAVLNQIKRIAAERADIYGG